MACCQLANNYSVLYGYPAMRAVKIIQNIIVQGPDRPILTFLD